MKANITLNQGQGNSIVIDGQDIAGRVVCMEVTALNGKASLIAMPGNSPTLTVTLNLDETHLNAEGDVVINAEPVSDEIGRAIYQSLKDRYEG